MTRLVLASGSPRRRDILTALGLSFDVRAPAVDESVDAGETAADAARRLAGRKARAAGARPGELVLSADTIVALDDHLLGKPDDAAGAVSMLARLSGRTHVVVTGLALATPSRVLTAVAATRVTFRRLASAEIAAYVATGEPLDKAGSYGIQGLGAALVERIEGDFYNVMGLPIPTLLALLEEAGWRYAFGRLERRRPAETGA